MSINYPDTPILDWLAWKMRITPVIPKFYWDAYSQEEIIKELSKELDSLAKYNEYLGTEMNTDRLTINQVAETLNELQAGGWFEEYSTIIEAWIRDIDNLEGIVADVLNETEIPDRVTALENELDGTGGIGERLTAAESDIDALENAVSGTGGIDERLTAAESDIDALENAVSGTGGIDERLTAAESDIDALDTGLQLEALRAKIPSRLHEAQARIRIPVDTTGTTVREIPEGGCAFGPDPLNPTYWATYIYHSVDTINGAETIGEIRVYRISDGQLVFSNPYDFGHGVSMSYDRTRGQIMVTELRRNMTNISNRAFLLDADSSGALTMHSTWAAPFNRLDSLMPYKGGYAAWVASMGTTTTVLTCDTLSDDASDWTELFQFNQTVITGGGPNQSMTYAEELDLFMLSFSSASMILFISPDGTYRRAMNIDAALGWICLEELQTQQIIGTRLYLQNSCSGTDSIPWTRQQTYATVWTAELGEARNYKSYASTGSDSNLEWTIAVNAASPDRGCPFINTTASTSGIGTVRLVSARDLIAMQHYPGRKNVLVQTKGYEDMVIPFINAGVCRLQVTAASITNSNLAESYGGVFVAGNTKLYPFQVPATFTINDAAVNNWTLPRLTSTTLKTFFSVAQGAELHMQTAPSSVVRTTSEAHAYAAIIDGVFSAPNPPIAYMAGTRAIVQTSANY